MMAKSVKLKEICDLYNGFAFKSKDYIEKSTTMNCRMSNIRPNGKFDPFYNPKYLPDSYSEKYKDYLLHDNDLIIAMTDMANNPKILGVPTVVKCNGHNLLLNQRVGKLVIIKKDIVNVNYLKFVLSSTRIRAYYKKYAGGGLQINIGKNDVLELQIPLPPLPIQKKIVEILDKAQQLIDLREKQIKLLDELVQSVFYDMFGDPVTNPKGWEKGIINDLTKKTQYGTGSKAHESLGEFPVLRMNNITYQGGWNFSSLKYVDLDEKEQAKYLVYKGEMLFNRTNSKELVGKTAVYKKGKPMAYAGYLVKLIPNESGNTEYISTYLNSKHGKLVLLNKAKNIVGMANINAEELKKIRILLPPIDLQNQFADKVEKIEAQKALMQESLEEMKNNYNCLMQRAFKGELFKEEELVN